MRPGPPFIGYWVGIFIRGINRLLESNFGVFVSLWPNVYQNFSSLYSLSNNLCLFYKETRSCVPFIRSNVFVNNAIILLILFVIYVIFDSKIISFKESSLKVLEPKNIRPYCQSQSLLFPPNLRDVIADDDLCMVVDDGPLSGSLLHL